MTKHDVKYENPEWEKARKALEAVGAKSESPPKQPSSVKPDAPQTQDQSLQNSHAQYYYSMYQQYSPQ